MFVDRNKAFMKDYVLCDHLPGCPASSGGIFGKVIRYMIRYEMQGRNSLHAHIMLWTSKEDKFAAGNEVVGCTPCIWDDLTQAWVVPTAFVDSEAHKVQFNHVLNKQQHYCTEVDAPGCRFRGTCK